MNEKKKKKRKKKIQRTFKTIIYFLDCCLRKMADRRGMTSSYSSTHYMSKFADAERHRQSSSNMSRSMRRPSKRLNQSSDRATMTSTTTSSTSSSSSTRSTRPTQSIHVFIDQYFVLILIFCFKNKLLQ